MRILCANWYGTDDAAVERRHYPDVDFIVARAPEGEASPLPPAVRDVDAIVNYSPTADLAEKPDVFPNVRIVVRAGVGFDNLDLKGWGARGVPVCNAPDYGTTEVADHALALMLALRRGTATYDTGREARAAARLGLPRRAADRAAEGRHLRHRRARTHRPRRGPPRRRLRHARRLLRSLPAERRRPLGRLRARSYARRADVDQRRRQHPHAALRRDPRHDRRRGLRRGEAGPGPGQHRARPDRRSRCARPRRSAAA